MSNHIVDVDLFQEVFKIVEIENEDSHLFSRLKKNCKVTEVNANTFTIEFKGDVKATIVNDLDVYYLDTNGKVYCNSEGPTTKLSGDRIAFYLNRILDLVIYGR